MGMLKASDDGSIDMELLLIGAILDEFYGLFETSEVKNILRSMLTCFTVCPKHV